jgi:excisionase family DNA binding protein
VLKVLSNPIYAGAYAYGRTGSGTNIEAGRKVIRRGLRKPQQSWDILLKDHHDGYISWETFEQHQRVIANNTNSRGEIVRGAVRTGEALLGGLLRCGHCGCKILVSYPGNAGYAKYHCRARFHLEGPQANCISFGAQRVDEAVAAAVVKAVEPEGLRAAVSAIDDHAVTRTEQHRHTELAIEAARFEAQRAKRQYDRVDPDNRLVASELERRWNERLDEIKKLEERLQSERAAAMDVLTDSERQVLLELGADVQRAWHHPAATNGTRKHIIRAVLCEVVVTKNNSVLDLTLHWQGGDHTQMKVPCNRTGEHRWVTSADVRSLIEVLARQTSDRMIAAILNRSGKRTAHGHTWNGGRIRAFRNDHKIAVYREGERADRGEVTLEEAAQLLGVDKMRVRRLITEGVIAASHLCHAAPWIIRRDALDTPRVNQAIRAGKRRSPVTVNPDQQSLDISNT